LELHDRSRDVWPTHRRTAQPPPDETGYALRSYVAALLRSYAGQDDAIGSLRRTLIDGGVRAHDASIGAARTRANRIIVMEGSTEVRSWLRCYRCWSQNLEVQVHYEGIHRIDPETGERGEVVDEMQEAVVQCLECMHDQPHLGFHNGRVEPIEDRWERMIAGTPWVASCTVTVDADDVETCSGPEAGDALSDAVFGDYGTREFFTHVRFHKHDEDRIVVHLLVELYARSAEEATEVLEEAARGTLAITSLAEESRPPASTGGDQH